MPSARSDHHIDSAFRNGREVVIPWERPCEALSALRTVGSYLAATPPQATFPGADELDGDRQAFWVACTGLGSAFHTLPAEIADFDGDAQGGADGLGALAFVSIRHALSVLRAPLDHALRLAVEAIGLDKALLPRLTVRYRSIRYQRFSRPESGIGLHPDGNLISALITEGDGLEVLEPEGFRIPQSNGTIVMPGSILCRWSRGVYRPTFHRVRIPAGPGTVKMSIVAFLNLPDRCGVPRSHWLGQEGAFDVDIRHFKEDDINPQGDLASMWRELSPEHWARTVRI